MTNIACQLCGATDAHVCMSNAVDDVTGRVFEILECAGCGLAWTTPKPASMDEYYPAVYRHYSGLTLWTLRRLYSWRVRCWARHFPTGGRVLEVGCGDGWMMSALRDRGWQVFASERSLSAAKSASEANQIPVFVGDLDALHSSAQFDLIILFQVLHMAREPIALLRCCAELLANGGTLVIAVPNFASWQARLFGRSWLHLDVPRHQTHFSPEVLRRALERVGFHVVNKRFVSPEHDPYGWVQSALNKMGFRQNLLTRYLMGFRDQHMNTPSVVATILLGGLLIIPSLLLSLYTWTAGTGAIMEFWAAKE